VATAGSWKYLSGVEEGTNVLASSLYERLEGKRGDGARALWSELGRKGVSPII
jgi:hypothetical protein